MNNKLFGNIYSDIRSPHYVLCTQLATLFKFCAYLLATSRKLGKIYRVKIKFLHFK